VGRGTGVDDAGLQRKLAVLAEAVEANAAALAPVAAGQPDPLAVLAAFGGFEIAMITGAMLEAAAQDRVIVVDGFIATSALLVAQALQPLVLQRCVFAHQSDESGHARMLAHLKAQPLLKLDLRLGEGSGAALAWPLLQSACVFLRDMASFEQAQVSQQEA
jgi:nicotinate-nucleotide--dimethylbenzimidazole phosphoribosyltransferase